MRVIEAFFFVAILCLIAATVAVPIRSCETVAQKMGMNHDFIFGQGCMIEPKPGQWVPLKAYRVTT